MVAEAAVSLAARPRADEDDEDGEFVHIGSEFFDACSTCFDFVNDVLLAFEAGAATLVVNSRSFDDEDIIV